MTRPSTLRSAIRLVLEGGRRRNAEWEPVEVPRRRPAVDVPAITVDPDRVRRFLRVTRGEAIDAFQDRRGLLPPTISALWQPALVLDLLGVAGVPLPLRGLIHLESELIDVRPLYTADRIRARIELDDVERHRKGSRLMMNARCWNAAGQLCRESRLALLLVAGAGHEKPRRAHGSSERADADWRALTEWTLPGSLGRKYARVSGDFNPVHLWAWTARPFGFRRPILHGYCIEAMVAHALIRDLFGGDPRALRRFQILFRAPLFLPARVRIEIDGAAGDRRRFRVIDARDSVNRVYAGGEFVGSVGPA